MTVPCSVGRAEGFSNGGGQVNGVPKVAKSGQTMARKMYPFQFKRKNTFLICHFLPKKSKYIGWLRVSVLEWFENHYY